MADKRVGKITQIIGAVLDIKFNDGELPEINEAIKITRQDGKVLVVEVSSHLGDDTVRCIAMGPTDGLVRGMEAVATGAPISVPVGEKTLGRMFNVLGEPIDNIEAPQSVIFTGIIIASNQIFYRSQKRCITTRFGKCKQTLINKSYIHHTYRVDILTKSTGQFNTVNVFILYTALKKQNIDSGSYCRLRHLKFTDISLTHTYSARNCKFCHILIRKSAVFVNQSVFAGVIG